MEELALLAYGGETRVHQARVFIEVHHVSKIQEGQCPSVQIM